MCIRDRSQIAISSAIIAVGKYMLHILNYNKKNVFSRWEELKILKYIRINIKTIARQFPIIEMVDLSTRLYRLLNGQLSQSYFNICNEVNDWESPMNEACWIKNTCFGDFIPFLDEDRIAWSQLLEFNKQQTLMTMNISSKFLSLTNLVIDYVMRHMIICELS